MAIDRIGIVSGVPEELAAFLPGVERRTAEASPLPVEQVAYAGKQLFLLCTGVGKVAAATAATLLRVRFGVDLLAVVGTAGKIGRIDGSLFRIVEAIQADYGAQRPAGLVHYTAGRLPLGPPELRAFRARAVPANGLATARIATSDLFIECPDHAAGVRDRLGAALVDMETAAVAQAAALLGIDWLAIKATTDSADGDSPDSFAANLHAAARAAAAALEEIIASL